MMPPSRGCWGIFRACLKAWWPSPSRRIGDLPLLTEAEKQQLLVEWNDTKTDYPKDKCIHELFEAQVEKTPDAIAVVFEDQQLTYRELNTTRQSTRPLLEKARRWPRSAASASAWNVRWT